MAFYNRHGFEDDDDRPQQNAAGTFKIPDKDFYRLSMSLIFDTSAYIICSTQEKL
jgi:hypothetical protein